MGISIDPEVDQRLANEVDRMAEILDKDTPPISFEEATLLGNPAHTSFREDTLLISPSAVQILSFDQLRTCIAYTLAVRVRINKMYRRTIIATWVGWILTITILILTAMQRILGLVSVAMLAVTFLLAAGRKQRFWQRISETDALVYRLVGDIEPVVEHIKTKGHRAHDGSIPDRPEVVERRIAALRSLMRSR